MSFNAHIMNYSGIHFDDKVSIDTRGALAKKLISLTSFILNECVSERRQRLALINAFQFMRKHKMRGWKF